MLSVVPAVEDAMSSRAIVNVATGGTSVERASERCNLESEC